MARLRYSALYATSARSAYFAYGYFGAKRLVLP